MRTIALTIAVAGGIWACNPSTSGLFGGGDTSAAAAGESAQSAPSDSSPADGPATAGASQVAASGGATNVAPAGGGSLSEAGVPAEVVANGQSGAADQTAVGGSAGSGQTINSKPPATTVELIDDMEHHYPNLPLVSGRNGAWFVAHDDSSDGNISLPQAAILEPARGASHYAAFMKGSGLSDWGAQLGLAVRAFLEPYDASAYCGIRFYAKGSGDGWTFVVADSLSDPHAGICDDGSADPSDHCYDHPGAYFNPTASWQLFKFDLETLSPVLGFTGQRRTLNRAAIYTIDFDFHNQDGLPFEILVDDLAFERCP